MTIPEETGKVVNNAIDALKSQPVLLVLVFLQVFQLGVIYFASQSAQQRMQEREIAILNRCFPPSHTKE